MLRNPSPRLFPAVLALAVLAAGCGGDGADAALESIRADAIRAHTRFLADDALEGRGTATRGMLVATNYVAAQFEALGLEPVGAPGSYFQLIPLRQIELLAERSSLTLVRGGRAQRLALAEDFLLPGHPLYTEAEVNAPVVFVGYGVAAPELDYDDYTGADVRGKVVAYLSGAPPRFPTTQRAHYSSTSLKLAEAAGRGAVGAIIIRTPGDERRFPWMQLARILRKPSLRWLDKNGVPNDAPPGIRGGAIVSRSGAEALLAGSGKTLEEIFQAAEESRPQSFALPVAARIRTVGRHRRTECANVVAALRGSDPQLRDEYVVYTAHLDHEGIGEPRNGDAIYNGALDNASGTAVLLEIAQAFARLPQPPRRSVLFLATTAEEEGLLGADYFAHHPTVPRERIVANVNIDAVPALVATRDFVALGAEHSTLGEVAARAASRLGLELGEDWAPEQVFFIRSDQYPFVKKGVPALFLFPGRKGTGEQADAVAYIVEWLGTRYHTPADDMSQPLDFDAAATSARLHFLIGYEVAQGHERPAWKPGDFFGEKYGRR